MPDKSEVIHAFVQAASAIPEVQLILLTGGGDDGERILTIIDAPRFSREIEHRVYGAELAAMDLEGDHPLVEFRLLNVQELAGPLETYVFAPRRVLFQREQVA